jgi:acyl carrier protein
MNIQIEEVTTYQQWTTLCAIRTQVFTTECGFLFTPLGLPNDPGVWHLLARDENGSGIGTLSIVDTTQDRSLHQGYHLAFGCRDRVARYAQLAIVKPYRKRGILKMLVNEAQRRIIRAKGFDVGWLLYPAAGAAACVLTRALGFNIVSPVLVTEFGSCHALVRRESDWWTTRDLQQEGRQRLFSNELSFTPVVSAQPANGRAKPDSLRCANLERTPMDRALKAHIARRRQVLDDIKRELVERLQIDLQPGDIEDDAPLFGGGLGLHSLDSRRIALTLEKRFAIRISEGETAALRTINTLADFVERARDIRERTNESVL